MLEYEICDNNNTKGMELIRKRVSYVLLKLNQYEFRPDWSEFRMLIVTFFWGLSSHAIGLNV